jgi:hypothetical protein
MVCACFFEDTPHRIFGARDRQLQLADPVRQQWQSPTLTPLRGHRARFSDQPCRAFGIEQGLFARVRTFFQRSQPTLREALAYTLDRQPTGVNSVGDVVVAPARIGFQQHARG